MAIERKTVHKVAVDPVKFYKMEGKTSPANVPVKLSGGPMRESIMGEHTGKKGSK